jgi:hypothetical protein
MKDSALVYPMLAMVVLTPTCSARCSVAECRR